MRYPKLREIREAIISLLTVPYTTKFPAEPHVPAKDYRGKPVVDDDHCVGCEACANVCPAEAITVTDDRENRTRIIKRDFGKCIFCGQCATHCLTGNGVKLSDTIYDMATFDRHDLIENQEKELLICEHCGAIITTREHVQYLHKKLGPLAYSSLLNLQVHNDKLQLAAGKDDSTTVTDDLKRKDMFAILCPDCLRTILVKNLT